MEELTQLFPSILILEAMNQTAKMVKKHPATERSVILRTVQNTAKGLLQQGQALGKHLKFGNVPPEHAAPKPAPKPRVEEQITDLRQDFQDLVTDNTWTITEDEARTMLKQHDAETLRSVFSQLGKQFTESQQQECMDLIDWKLSAAFL